MDNYNAISWCSLLHSGLIFLLSSAPTGTVRTGETAVRLLIWLYNMTGCPKMFLSFLWLYHQHNLSIKDRGPGVSLKALYMQTQENYWKTQRTKPTAPAQTNKDSLNSHYINHWNTHSCAHGLWGRGGKREIKLPCYYYILSIWNLYKQAAACEWKEERLGTKEGG